MTENLKLKSIEVNAKNIYDFMQIRQKHEYLIAVDIEIIEVSYSLTNVLTLKDVKEFKERDIYHALLIVLELKHLSRELLFNLNEDNLFLNQNLQPLALCRDVYPNRDEYHDDIFTLQIKALIGALFSKNYKYSDVYNGGSIY